MAPSVAHLAREHAQTEYQFYADNLIDRLLTDFLASHDLSALHDEVGQDAVAYVRRLRGWEDDIPGGVSSGAASGLNAV
jgi:hypothetical protein